MGGLFRRAGVSGLVAAAVLAAGVLTAGPARAAGAAPLPAPVSHTATAAPTPTGSVPQPVPTPPAPGVDGVPTGADPQRLSPAELAAQVSAARALLADLGRSSARIAAANAALQRLSVQSSAALADLSRARAAEVAARAEALRQLARFRILAGQAQAERVDVGHWAYDAYINGGPLVDYMTVASLLTSQTPDDAADPLALLHYVADARGRALDRLEGLTADQQDAASRAQAASEDALAAELAARATQARLGRLLADQRRALAALQQAQAGQLARVGTLRGALLQSPAAAAREVDRRLARQLGLSGALEATDSGSGCSGPVLSAGYANGAMPAAALCPLYRMPGRSLRTDAARAFNAMSRAYERATGSPLCVTDAYRSYAGQVAVALQRPGFAARPGTSHHGLGLAVDLCGGVESFATPAHLWMLQHAPLYGWFHPDWAEPTGLLPEPWHWEFAG